MLVDRPTQSTRLDRVEALVTTASESATAHHFYVDPHDAIGHLGDTPRLVEFGDSALHQLGVNNLDGDALYQDAPARSTVVLVVVDFKRDDIVRGCCTEFRARNGSKDHGPTMDREVHRQYHRQRANRDRDPTDRHLRNEI